MSPKFEYLCYWFMLHRLVDLGLDSTALADDLRDEMEDVGWRLSANDTDQIDAISSLLNSERDVVTAERTERVEELDATLRWMAEWRIEYWKQKRSLLD